MPKCYLHYGKQRNSDAESIPESRMISPPWESPAHRESSLAVALSSLCSKQKAAVTMVGPGLFRQKNVIFSQSPGVSFPLPQHSWDARGPHSAIQSMGPHPAAGAAGASFCTAATVGRVRASISWPWIVSKDIAELLALNKNIYLLFLATGSFIIVLF